MNVLFVIIGTAIILLIAYFGYGRFLSKKVFRLDDSRTTPAVEINDSVDYVPAKTGMLLGQHFSAIAAAGPINGPILASVMFGWVLKKGHPTVPWVSMVLIILSVLVAIETAYSIFSKKGAADTVALTDEYVPD